MAVATVALAGCSAQATLTLTVRNDGSGTAALRVTLDREAVRAAEGDGTPLAQRVRLDDLRQAGWSVAPWTNRPDGSATITVTKRFSAPGQIAGITRELSGSGGPLRGVHAARDPVAVGLAHRFSVAGTIDLGAATPGIPADAALVARLTGQHVDVNAVEADLAGRLHSSVSVRVVIAVPGRRHVTVVKPGAKASLATSATRLDTTRLAYLAAAVVLVLAALFAWRRSRGPRPARP